MTDPVSVTQDLLPCPFCGAENPEWVFGGDYVQCGSCLATMPQHDLDVPGAIARWNTRPTPDTRPAAAGSVREAAIAAITRADASFGYSYRMTKMDDTGEEHTLFMDGFEPAIFEDREDGYLVIEQRRNTLRADAVLKALTAAPTPDAAASASTAIAAGRPCNFYLGDCTRCGKRADRDNQQEPCRATHHTYGRHPIAAAPKVASDTDAAASEAGEDNPAEQMQSQFSKMLREDNRAMRIAGGRLAEAAVYTVHNYDGLHRLSDAAGEWSKTVSAETNRSRFMTHPPRTELPPAITSTAISASEAGEVARLRRLLCDLERSASAVHRKGATTGPQWSRLGGDLIRTRAALTTQGGAEG